MVKVRFAPSPTGHLHVGNAKIALLNYLFVKKEGGRFILRIEDTDLERSDTSYESSILDDLMWLGISWDEGPLRQTERFALYHSYVNDLLRKDAAYKCFCSRETLEEMRSMSLKKGEPPRYDGRCKKLSKHEISDLEKNGAPHVIRFNASSRMVPPFDDIVYRGKVTFPPYSVDDFILMKQGGTPSYNFAAAVDDMLMGITHVIRGADHISNTPKQIMLFKVFGATPPQYGHLSLLVGDDDKPLSKRHGVTRIRDFREMGILPEALRNYLCTVGRSVSKEIMSMEEMIATFSLTSLSRTNSFFDLEKLYWFNKEYLKHLPPDVLLAYLQLSDDYGERIAVLRENAATLKELEEYLHIFDRADMNEDATSYLSAITLPEGFINKVAIFFTAYQKPSFENVVDSLIEESGLKKKDFYMVLRIILTGRKSGPPLKEIFQLIHPEIIKKRIDNYLATSQKS